MTRPNVICIVPVRNEAWILNNFIECAEKWADVIIVGDHASTDQTAVIAQHYDKVKLVSLHDTSIDRGVRRKMLLDEARKIPGKRLIFSIDADEMISANWSTSPEWAMMLNAKGGTRFQFDWLEILPGIQEAAVFSKVVAFMDDGSEYIGAVKHEPLIPVTNGDILHLKDIKLLHYILIEPTRMFSKHRWNKCFEIVELGKRPWPMCVMYQDIEIKTYDAPRIPIKAEWLDGYGWLDEYRSGPDRSDQVYWYDNEVLDYFDTFGIRKFRKLNIWDVDWSEKARQLGRNGMYPDPRSAVEKWIHKFIERHREELKLKKTLKWKLINKFGATVLRLYGW